METTALTRYGAAIAPKVSRSGREVGTLISFCGTRAGKSPVAEAKARGLRGTAKKEFVLACLSGDTARQARLGAVQFVQAMFESGREATTGEVTDRGGCLRFVAAPKAGKDEAGAAKDAELQALRVEIAALKAGQAPAA